MNEWQFWNEGIIGILLTFLGITNLVDAFYYFPNRLKKKTKDPKAIQKKCRLWKILGVVSLLFGILILLGYIDI